MHSSTASSCTTRRGVVARLTADAANNLPNPSLDLGTFQRHLDDLTIPADVADRLRAILRAPRDKHCGCNWS
jgi:hypothetical protein